MERHRQIPEMAGGEAFLRLLAQSLGGLLPDTFQYSLFRQIKALRLRILGRGDFDSLLHSWDDCLQENPSDEGGTGGMFAITHDVDYRSCCEYLPVLLEINRELGIKATYNFLTRGGYELENTVLRSVLDAGNEVGLHGLTHDRAVGCRSRQYIREFIGTSKQELEKKAGKVRGFRAPALAVTSRLVEVLDELDFQYESSLTNTSLSSRFTPGLRPFMLAGSRVTEIPLTVQDSILFNDFSLTVEQVDCLFDKLIKMIRRNSACLVGNFHPTVIRDNRKSYERIIQILKTGLKQDCLMRDVSAKFSGIKQGLP